MANQVSFDRWAVFEQAFRQTAKPEHAAGLDDLKRKLVQYFCGNGAGSSGHEVDITLTPAQSKNGAGYRFVFVLYMVRGRPVIHYRGCPDLERAKDAATQRPPTPRRRNPRNPRKSQKPQWPKMAGLLLLLLGAVSLWAFSLGGGDEMEAATEPTREPPAGFPAFTVEANVTELTDTGYLKLVNRTRSAATPTDPAQLVEVWEDIPVRAIYITLRETAATAVIALFAAAEQAGHTDLFVASGFRSEDEQQNIYQNAVDRAYVLPPGHSEHQLGLAVDILSSGNQSTGGMAGTPEAAWLAEHAPAFGLLLSYPYEKQNITGVAYEPWHFRYVGRVHAWYMGRQNFVLEEYINYLQRVGGTTTTFDGRTYYILYQQPEGGTILVPEGLDFQVSSANTGGYIVTAWR
ncbi:MAG: M15 family metallopeptidase [Oscillospiraceae bacterium]|nr:M15 family metallopeptidase [Oscillospiraceae bacterium]